jgi:serine/tyrosine/threonine adenylyltransferase
MMDGMAGWRLENSYAELPQLFYSRAAPTAVSEPRVVAFNWPLATMLGLEPETLEGTEGAAIFAGNALPEGGRPITQAYARHQFGHFTPLGDGRAILLILDVGKLLAGVSMKSGVSPFPHPLDQFR